jgi:hypothetical protein
MIGNLFKSISKMYKKLRSVKEGGEAKIFWEKIY